MQYHDVGRSTIGATALAGLGLSRLVLRAARAQGAMAGDSYDTEGGAIVIHPVEHASFVMTEPGLVIYNDPVGGAAATPACRRRA